MDILYFEIHRANLLHSSTDVSLFPHFQSRHLSTPDNTNLPLTLIAFSRVILGQREKPLPKVKLVCLVIISPSSITLLFVLQFPLIRRSFDYANMQLRWAPCLCGMRCLSPWRWMLGVQTRPVPPPAGLFDTTLFPV